MSTDVYIAVFFLCMYLAMQTFTNFLFNNFLSTRSQKGVPILVKVAAALVLMPIPIGISTFMATCSFMVFLKIQNGVLPTDISEYIWVAAVCLVILSVSMSSITYSSKKVKPV